MAAQNVYSKDTINGARLTALLINEGTEVVRKVFLKIISPDTLVNVLNTNQNILKALVPKTLNNRQFLLLFPKSGQQPSIQDYDLSLMFILIRNLSHLYGGLRKPNWPGWVNRPAPTDVSFEADLARLRLFRNELYGHVATTGIDDINFTSKWQELEVILVRLGADKSRVDQWFTESFNHDEEEHVKEVLTQSYLDDQQTKLMVDSLKDSTSQSFQRLDEGLKKLSDALEVIKLTSEQQHDENVALSKKTAESLQAFADHNNARAGNITHHQKSSEKNDTHTLSTELREEKGAEGERDMLTHGGDKTHLKPSTIGTGHNQQVLRESIDKPSQVTLDYASTDRGYSKDKVIDELMFHYKHTVGRTQPLPWLDYDLDLEEVYTRLEIIGERREISMEQMFDPLSRKDAPKRVLIYGKPGIGKSTVCRKLALDWTLPTTNYAVFNFEFVLLLEAKHVTGNILEALYDQIIPIDSCVARSEFKTYVSETQHRHLIVVDGIDELSKGFDTDLFNILTGKLLRHSTVVVTSRPDNWMKIGASYGTWYDRHLNIKGYTLENAIKYVGRYFRCVNPELPYEGLTEGMKVSPYLKDLAHNPLNVVLMCVLWEDTGKLPNTRLELYEELVYCICRRFCAKNSIEMCGSNLPKICDKLMFQTSSIAFEGFESGRLTFEEADIKEKYKDDYLYLLGFITKEHSSSRIRRHEIYVFPHKTLQEFFAAYRIVRFDKEKRMVVLSKLAAEFPKKDTEVFIFAMGMLRSIHVEEIPQMLDIVNPPQKELHKCNRKARLNSLLSEVQDDSCTFPSHKHHTVAQRCRRSGKCTMKESRPSVGKWADLLYECAYHDLNHAGKYVPGDVSLDLSDTDLVGRITFIAHMIRYANIDHVCVICHFESSINHFLEIFDALIQSVYAQTICFKFWVGTKPVESVVKGQLSTSDSIIENSNIQFIGFEIEPASPGIHVDESQLNFVMGLIYGKEYRQKSGLQGISVCSTLLSPHSVCRLIGFLKEHCCQLLTLDITYATLSYDTMSMLGSLCSQSGSMKRLYICDCTFSLSDFEGFTKSLLEGKYKTLNDVVLRACSLDVSFCPSLQKIIECLDIVALDLSHNKLDCESIMLLEQSMKSNTALAVLNLEYNPISDKGVGSLSRIIEENQNLHILYADFQNCSAGAVHSPVGCSILGENHQHCTKRTFGLEALAILQQAASSSQSFKWLVLPHCHPSEEKRCRGFDNDGKCVGTSGFGCPAGVSVSENRQSFCRFCCGKLMLIQGKAHVKHAT
ncbi:NACHT, LRR and PYD domains-containing protein 3-like [Ptychodera flava]|uniref:NACHT, LRR and PYD domains-containing protein 3-like n=1 Tax=Ptychodera flava TaxID=63121 RepID=UPI00396A4D24